MFRRISPKYDFPALERKVLEFWKERRVFEKSLEARAEAPEFVFYEGPPTANGKPHPGHVLTRVIKDLFPRYKTMCGYKVERKAGWDTHGLPVEIEVEKNLGISGKDQIEDYGVLPFVKKCVESVFTYVKDWEALTERIGFWIDLDSAYVTYATEYVESVWWALKEMWKKGLLYEGHKVVPYCPRCGTALSSHEVGLGYKEVADPSVYVRFRALGEDGVPLERNGKPVYFLAWTTTPWTLISNAALTVHPEFEYAFVEMEGEILVLASDLLGKVLGDDEDFRVIERKRGRELERRRYQPLYEFASVPEGKAHFVITGEFVTLDTGTGIVHTAPAFGQDDYEVARPYEIPVIQLVDEAGRFKPEVTPWAGREVKKTDPAIIRELENRGLLFRRETYKHDYPHCWRCETPLLYYARRSWFVRTTQVRDEMLRLNDSIGWRPDHIRTGRFGNFLRDNVDWALSRERFWGTPLPIWKCSACGFTEAIGSRNDLLERNPKAFEPFEKEKEKDPELPDMMAVHKPFIDGVIYACPECGGEMKRVPEVIDCWFDSGSMPFAQWGYQPELGRGEKVFGRKFPGDFISEAIDQTRGWFYSLLAISTILFDRPAYKNCIVLGLVCDEKGLKMSKSKGNYLEPWDILDKDGADAMRWYFYLNSAPAQPVRFFPEAVREAQKDFLLKIWNVYSFFTIYAVIDGFEPEAGGVKGVRPEDFSGRPARRPVSERPLLDRWVTSELAVTVRKVRDALDGFDYMSAAKALWAFVDGLSNWYVRRSRDRFWKSEKDQDKWDAYWTLYEVLTVLSRLVAPFTPFIAEELYQNLLGERSDSLPVSVHLTDYPTPDELPLETDLVRKMELARDLVSLGRAARAEAKIKVRQPLSKAVVLLADPAEKDLVEDLAHVISDELNVKDVVFERDPSRYVHFSVKPNFRLLGPRFGKRMKALQAVVAQADPSALKAALDEAGSAEVYLDGEKITLSQEELVVSLVAKEHYAASGNRRAVVVLETDITPELHAEGLARELVSRIQNFRKELDLPYEERIFTWVDGPEEILQVVSALKDYISSETLSRELSPGPAPDCDYSTEVKVEGTPVTISIRRDG